MNESFVTSNFKQNSGAYIMQPTPKKKGLWETTSFDVHCLKESCDKLHHNLESKSEKVDALVKELQSIRVLYNSRETELESVSNMFYKVNIERKSLAKELSRLKSYSDKLEIFLSRMQEPRSLIMKIDKLQNQLKLYKERISSLESNLQMRDQKSSKLENQFETFKQYSIPLVAINESISGKSQSNIRGQKLDITAMDGAADGDITNSLYDQISIQSILNEISERRSDTHALSISLAACNQELISVREQRDNLLLELQSLQKHVDHLTSQTIQDQDERCRNSSLLNSLTEENQELQKKLHDNNEEYSLKIQSLEQQLSTQKSYSSQLQVSLQESNHIQSILKEKLQEAQILSYRLESEKALRKQRFYSESEWDNNNELTSGNNNNNNNNANNNINNVSKETIQTFDILEKQINLLTTALIDAQVARDDALHSSQTILSTSAAVKQADQFHLQHRLDASELTCKEQLSDIADLKLQLERLLQERDQATEALMRTVRAAKYMSQELQREKALRQSSETKSHNLSQQLYSLSSPLSCPPSGSQLQPVRVGSTAEYVNLGRHEERSKAGQDDKVVPEGLGLGLPPFHASTPTPMLSRSRSPFTATATAGTSRAQTSNTVHAEGIVRPTDYSSRQSPEVRVDEGIQTRQDPASSHPRYTHTSIDDTHISMPAAVTATWTGTGTGKANRFSRSLDMGADILRLKKDIERLEKSVEYTQSQSHTRSRDRGRFEEASTSLPSFTPISVIKGKSDRAHYSRRVDRNQDVNDLLSEDNDNDSNDMAMSSSSWPRSSVGSSSSSVVVKNLADDETSIADNDSHGRIVSGGYRREGGRGGDGGWSDSDDSSTDNQRPPLRLHQLGAPTGNAVPEVPYDYQNKVRERSDSTRRSEQELQLKDDYIPKHDPTDQAKRDYNKRDTGGELGSTDQSPAHRIQQDLPSSEEKVNSTVSEDGTSVSKSSTADLFPRANIGMSPGGGRGGGVKGRSAARYSSSQTSEEEAKGTDVSKTSVPRSNSQSKISVGPSIFSLVPKKSLLDLLESFGTSNAKRLIATTDAHQVTATTNSIETVANEAPANSGFTEEFPERTLSIFDIANCPADEF